MARRFYTGRSPQAAFVFFGGHTPCVVGRSAIKTRLGRCETALEAQSLRHQKPVPIYLNPSRASAILISPLFILLYGVVSLFLSPNVSFADSGVASHQSCSLLHASGRPSNIIGYAQPIFGNGVLVGWAFDSGDPSRKILINFYIDAEGAKGGTLAGEVEASYVNVGIDWRFGINGDRGDHGFAFRIPDRWRDGLQHSIYAQPVQCDGDLAAPLTIMGGYSFSLSPSSKPNQQSILDTHCLDPSSRCLSYSDDYLTPNFPASHGWSDGVNYFYSWGCRSAVGINEIERLNIIPIGAFGPHFQKDSVYINWEDMSDPNIPIVFFTATSKDHAPKWSLKKAVFDISDQQWRIYSVLDNPHNAGGLSSQDGRGKNIIMNDYSLPGWGPSSPIPGSETKIPGVSEISASADHPTYPLLGTGPLGITAMTNLLYPAEKSAGVEGRTCIHMNPKLLDYDAQGSPHTLIANLWQASPHDGACHLPPGAPITELPFPGNYLYRYVDKVHGWQLDLSIGLVSDSLHDPVRNKYLLTPKLLAGTEHTLILATWDGLVEILDAGPVGSKSTNILLDCQAGGVHFGEGTGRKDSFFFLATEADVVSQRIRYGLASDVLPLEIYHAFVK